MPDRKSLSVGQRIRLLRVPEGDLIQREHELQSGEIEDPGWTADTIERILARDPIVTISTIDEYGIPWFEYAFSEHEIHSIAIMEDDSWEYADGG